MKLNTYSVMFVVIVLKVLDELTTFIVLNYGFGFESNSIPSNIYNMFGVNGHFINFSLAVGVFYLLWKLTFVVDFINNKFLIHNYGPSFRFGLFFANFVLYFLVVVNNIGVILY